MANDINAIRMNADIVKVIGSYIPLNQRGKNYICVCPFHDDHSPSMSVSPEKQIFKCFSCGKTGNVFTFVEEYENVSFLEAVSIVASKCGLEFKKVTNTKVSTFKEDYDVMNLAEKFFQNNLRTEFGKVALKYLQERGLNEENIKEMGIGLSLDDNKSLIKILNKKGYDNKKLLDLSLISSSQGEYYDMFNRRITFPLYDKDGNIVGFSGRIYRNEKDVSKYVNSRETKIFKKGETLYNYHIAKNAVRTEKKVILVEGFMDAIRLIVNGYKNVIALQGTAMTKEQIDLIKKLRCPVILSLDNDNAGLIATLNNGEELVKNNIDTEVIRLTGEKDPDEYILANGIDAYIDNINHAISYFEFKINYLKENKDLNKIEDLTEYINDVLKNLSTNNDLILREITLKKLAKEYDLSIDTLQNKLNEYQPVQNIKHEKQVKKEIKKTAFQKSCEKILYYMMNDMEYVNLYQNSLGFFSDIEYREIANEIVYYCDKNKNINLADFITYTSDKKIKDKVLDIVSSSEMDDLNKENMLEYINAVNKLNNKNEIKRLKALMKEETDIDKKMKLAMQIAELKKEDV